MLLKSLFSVHRGISIRCRNIQSVYGKSTLNFLEIRTTFFLESRSMFFQGKRDEVRARDNRLIDKDGW